MSSEPQHRPTAAQDRDSQFPRPNFECRGCGRTDEHTYCQPWLTGLLLVMVLLARAGFVTMFVVGAFYGA